MKTFSLILIASFLYVSLCSNSKLKMASMDFSNTQYMFQNISFVNLEDGVVLIPTYFQARYVETFDEMVRKNSVLKIIQILIS